jgi:hypothetical protein
MTEESKDSNCPFCNFSNANSGNVSQHINQSHRGCRYQQKNGVFTKPNIVKKGNTNKSDSRSINDVKDNITV